MSPALLIGLVSSAGVGYFLLRHKAQPPVAAVAAGTDPTPAPSTAPSTATQAFQNLADGASHSAPGFALPKISIPHPQDLSSLSSSGQFSSQEIVAAAQRAAGGWIPHQVAQEGVHTEPGGRRYVMIKYVRAGVGSDTRKVYL